MYGAYLHNNIINLVKNYFQHELLQYII